MKWLLILLLLGTLVSGQCHSSCMNMACIAYGPNQCTNCPSPLIQNNLHCINGTLSTNYDIIDSLWVNTSAQYCSEIVVGSTNSSQTLGFLWPVVGYMIYRSPTLPTEAGEVIFNIYNLPAVFQIEFRFSVEEDFGLGTGSVIMITGENNFNYQSKTSTLAEQTFSVLLNMNGLTNKTVRISSDIISSNSYFILKDATFIYQLCDANCKTCLGSSFSCTSCGLNPLGQQTYLDAVSASCQPFCFSNYYINDPTFQCDVCHVSCYYCFAPLSNVSCISCNNAAGYRVKSALQPYTCSLGCQSGETATGFPLTCTPCLGCQTCSVTATNCTSCNGSFLSGNLCETQCPATYYGSSLNWKCELCNAPCIECTGPLPTNCKTCGLSITTGLQLYLDGTLSSCVDTCLTNFLINPPYYECNVCYTGCHTCSQPSSNTSCLECNNNGGFVAQSPTSTNICVTSCLANQIIFGSPLSCTPCNSSCNTCSVIISNCTSCSGLFLQGNSCLGVCSDYFYGETTNWKCSPCYKGCKTCTDPTNTTCTSCGNITTTAGIQIFYKPSSANATQCLTACPAGELIDPYDPNKCVSSCPDSTYLFNGVCYITCPGAYFGSSQLSTCVLACLSTEYLDTGNICQPCNTTCLTCVGNSNYCTSCPAGQFYYETPHSCLTSCPNTTYSMNYNCHDTCPSGFFGQTTQMQCVTSCGSGFYGDVTNNKCLACSSSCVTCSGTSTNCTGNICQTNYYYYKNSCISSCPNNTYTFNGQCLEECPAGYIGSVGTISTCVVCTSSVCQTTFNVATRVINGGENYEHRVDLLQGLSQQSNMEAIRNGMTVALEEGTGRLLLTTVSLSVSSVTLSAGRNFLTIMTNYYPADPSSSTISINFQAGTLLASNGSLYNQLSGTVSLSNPTFLNSYYQVFNRNIYMQAEGIIFVLISFLLLVGSYILKNNKLTAECLAFVAMIQIFGLSRVRDAPYNFSYFDTVVGYSHYEMRFVPNAFSFPFYQNNYSETSIDSAVFAFGMQNFIVAFGSIFYFLIGLQLCLLGYLIYLRQKPNEQGLKLFKTIQYSLVYFWANILIYGSALCLLSLQNNTISSSNLQYSFTILLSFFVLTAYTFYFLYRVRKRINHDLYKVNNLFRLISLIMLAHNYDLGFVVFNFSELLFFTADLTLYRREKPNLFLYIFEKIAFWIALDASLLRINYIALLVIAGLAFGSITIIKIFYLVKVILVLFLNSDNVNADGSVDFIKMGQSNVASSKMQSQAENNSQQEISIKEKRLGKNSDLQKADSFNTLNQASIVFEHGQLQDTELPKTLSEKNGEQENNIAPVSIRKSSKKRKSRPEILKIVDLSKQFDEGEQDNPRKTQVVIEQHLENAEEQLERPSSPPKSPKKQPTDPELYWPEEQYD